MELETEVPTFKSKRLRKLAETTASPIGTLVFRALIGVGVAVLAFGVGIFNLGLKTRAEQAIAESPVFREAAAKADEAAKRSWEVAHALEASRTESREKDTELANNLTQITASLKQVADQQVEISKQQAANSTAIAVLTSHAGDVDKQLARHDNAIESIRGQSR